MNILCFASEPKRLTMLLKAVTDSRIKNACLVFYRTIDELYRKLCQPKTPGDIVILCPRNKGELGVLNAIQEVFSDTKVIVVLPDRKKDSIELAHMIAPRFLAFADEDPANITMIVEKMCDNGSGSTRQRVKRAEKTGRSGNKKQRAATVSAKQSIH